MLVAAGNNKPMAFAEIDEKDLLKIEAHLNANRQYLNKIKCCYIDQYKAQGEFHFLPGHRATILGLKHKVNELKQSRIQNPRPKQASNGKEKREWSESELKATLLKSLQAYLVKVNLPADVVSENNIFNFVEKVEAGHKVYKCNFSCLFCDKLISVVYRSFWMNSNVTNHFRDHATRRRIIATDDITLHQSQINWTTI